MRLCRTSSTTPTISTGHFDLAGAPHHRRADGVRVAEVLAHDTAIHDRRHRRRRIVTAVEVTASHQRRAHRLEVAVSQRLQPRFERVRLHLIERAPRRRERAGRVFDTEQDSAIGKAGKLRPRGVLRARR